MAKGNKIDKKHDKDKRNAAMTLLKQGKSQKWIANQLDVSRQNVSYWANHPIAPRKRTTKLNEKEIDEIVKLAVDKTTGEIGSRTIASIMNEKFKKEGKNVKTCKSSVNNYLKKRGIKLRKIKKIFALYISTHLNFCFICKKNEFSFYFFFYHFLAELDPLFFLFFI